MKLSIKVGFFLVSFNGIFCWAVSSHTECDGYYAGNHSTDEVSFFCGESIGSLMTQTCDSWADSSLFFNQHVQSTSVKNVHDVYWANCEIKYGNTVQHIRRIGIGVGKVGQFHDDDDKHCPYGGTNPIDLRNGYKIQTEKDLVSPIGSELAVERVYTSRTAVQGWLWSNSTNDKKLVIRKKDFAPYCQSNPSIGCVPETINYEIFIDAHRPDGTIARFNSLQNTHFRMIGSDMKDLYSSTLLRSTNPHRNMNISFDDASARWELFNAKANETEYYSDEGVFLGAKKVNGYKVTITLMSGNIIDRIDDNLGQWLDYTTDEIIGSINYGNIQFIESSWGEVAHYIYDDNGRLSKVGLGTNRHALEDFVYKEYHYEDYDFPSGLTGISDENGDRYATWTYNDNNLATSSSHGELGVLSYDDLVTALSVSSSPIKTLIDFTSVSYGIDNTVVTNSLGKKTKYFWKHQYRNGFVDGRIKVTDKIEGESTDSCAGGWKNFEYDSNGYVSKKSKWHESESGTGERIFLTNNSRGLPTRTVFRDRYTAPYKIRTIKNTWHTTYRLKTEETIAYGYSTDVDVVTTHYDYDPINLRLLVKTVTDLTTHTAPYASNGNTQVWTYSYTYWDAEETQLKTMAIDGPRTDVSDAIIYEYNQHGFLTKTSNALGHVFEVLEHSPHGHPARVIDANGIETRMTYHFRGWLESVTTENGANDAATTIIYDNVGQVIDISLPNGSGLHYDYDSAHRLYKITDHTGASIEYLLDAAGNRTAETVKDNSGTLAKSQTYVFDELSRLREIISASNQSVAYGYDVNDNLTAVTDGKFQISNFSYDGLDRLKQQADPNNFRINYTYDAEGRITSVKDQRNLITSYKYDGLGNLMQVISPDTGTTSYTYDSAGNRISQTDARGAITLYTYDALNRLTSVSYPANPAENIIYTYDDASNGNKGVGRLTGITDESGSTTYTYDFLGNVASKTASINSVVYGIQYSYDLTGNITQMTYPSGRLVNYSYDSLGRISGITTQANAGASIETVVSNVTYLPFGPVSGYTYGNGLVQTLNYDQDYRLIANQSQGTANPLNLGYGYDLNNNIETITDQLNSSNNQAFQYDPVNRLKQATGQYGQLGYQYNGVGNRIQQVITEGVDIATETYSYDATSNQLNEVSSDGGSTQTQRRFQYNANGDLIQHIKADGTVDDFFYNEAGRYVQLDKTYALRAFYTYNALGQRMSKTAVGGTTITDHYHYDELGRLLAVSASTGVPKREIIYMGNIQVAMLINSNFATEWDGFDGGPDADVDGVPDSSDNCPNDPNPNQTDADADMIGNVCDPVQLMVSSIGTEDGWARESGENTDIGKNKNNKGTGNKAIRFGDYRNNRQFKAILSFDLAAIPAGSALTAANIQLTRKNGSLVGDTSALGASIVDLKIGAFNDNSALEKQDFQAPATLTNVGAIIDGLTATAAINSGGVAAIQTAKNSGENKVQLRLQYSVDDDNDSTDDYTGYYSGSTSNASRHPKLIIDYTLAD